MCPIVIDRRIAFLILLFFGPKPFALADSSVPKGEAYRHFERKIRPLLARYCYECHSSKAKPVHAGLRLDSAAGVKKGGDSGRLSPSQELWCDRIRQITRGLMIIFSKKLNPT